MGFSGSASDKESTFQCRSHKKLGFDPWVGKIPWRRVWQHFCLENPYGQKSLAGYSPWGLKKSGMTEVAEHAHVCICTTN